MAKMELPQLHDLGPRRQMAEQEVHRVPPPHMFFEAFDEWRLGLVVGLAVGTPFLGRILGLPGRIWGVLLVLIAVLLLIRRERVAPEISVLVFLGLSLLFFLVVVINSEFIQFEFLIDVTRWLGHADYYREAKLMNFLLSYIPILALAVAVVTAFNKEAILAGIMVAFIGLAACAVIRISLDASILVRTDYETARPFYVGEGRGQYSNISMSTLLFLGIIACLPRFIFRLSSIFAILSGIFLFMMIWINQRADTIFVISAVVVFSGLCLWWRKEFRSLKYISRIAVSFLIAGALITFLHNEVNVDYWADGGAAGYSDRLSLAADAVAPPMEGAGGAAMGNPYWWTGRGLGAFALWHPDLRYPHNVFLEVWFELGFWGVAPLLAATLLAATIGASRGLTGCFTPSGMAIWMMGAVLLLNALKAGDISSVGCLFFMLVVAISVRKGAAVPGGPAK